MKLSDIKGEEALDVLADIIDPATEIMSDKEILHIYQSGQSKIKLIKFMLKKHKKSVIEILAILNQEDPEEYTEKINVLTLPMKLLEVVNDMELEEVFSLQGQEIELNTFGSATGNTEEAEE